MSRSLLLFLLVFTSQIVAQEVSITFEVNMSYQIELGNYDPVTETVDVAGSFNGWGSTQTQLFDEDGDSTYSVTLDGFTVGNQIAFKFRQNFAWDGTEEFPGVGNDRFYMPIDGENIINVWYNNEVSPNGPPVADFIAISTDVVTNSLVPFINRSSGKIDEFQWTFEG